MPSPDLPGLDVVPATIDLAGAEIELVSVVARESRLDRALRADPDRHRRRPRPEPLRLRPHRLPAVAGPAHAERAGGRRRDAHPDPGGVLRARGARQLLETVEMVRQHLNPRLVVSTILVTMYDARTRLAAGVADEVREHFGDQVLRTSIPRSVRVSEAPSYGQTVMTYDPASPGALSYLEAAREIVIKGAPASQGPAAGQGGVRHEQRRPTRAPGPGSRSRSPDPDRPASRRARRRPGPPGGRWQHPDGGHPASGEGPRCWPWRAPGSPSCPSTASRPNQRQPREVFDEDAMAELVFSIREVGLLQPVVVRTRRGGRRTSW